MTVAVTEAVGVPAERKGREVKAELAAAPAADAGIRRRLVTEPGLDAAAPAEDGEEREGRRTGGGGSGGMVVGKAAGGGSGGNGEEPGGDAVPRSKRSVERDVQISRRSRSRISERPRIHK